MIFLKVVFIIAIIVAIVYSLLKKAKRSECFAFRRYRYDTWCHAFQL